MEVPKGVKPTPIGDRRSAYFVSAKRERRLPQQEGRSDPLHVAGLCSQEKAVGRPPFPFFSLATYWQGCKRPSAALKNVPRVQTNPLRSA